MVNQHGQRTDVQNLEFMINSKIIFCFSLFFFGCASQLVTGVREQRETDYLLSEIRIDIAELRQQINHHKVEFQILDEKLEKLTVAKSRDSTLKNGELAKLEKKVYDLEKLLEKTKEDLREIASHANQTTATFIEYRNKIAECEKQIAHQSEVLDEIAKLKGTLKSISKAMHEGSSGKIHKVKSGDSLEKIARLGGVSIDELKKINGLSTDTIFIGQELKLPP